MEYLILTEVKLTIVLFTINNIKPVVDISHCITNFKIEPLMMVFCVYVRAQ